MLTYAKAVLTWPLIAALLTSCATPPPHPYDPMRVAVLDVKVNSAADAKDEEVSPAQVQAAKGVRTAMESELLSNNITVVDDSEIAAVKSRLAQASESGIHTTATDVKEYQPAATHGIIMNVDDNIGLLSIITLGLFPVSADATARLIDLRTGEVRASVQATSYGFLWASGPGMSYRAVRKLADGIASTLKGIQENSRHLRTKDWPSPYQQDSSDPSAEGRYTHAIYLRMAGSDDMALDSLEEAVRLDKSFAEKARSAWELEPLRNTARFKSITRERSPLKKFTGMQQ